MCCASVVPETGLAEHRLQVNAPRPVRDPQHRLPTRIAASSIDAGPTPSLERRCRHEIPAAIPWAPAILTCGRPNRSQIDPPFSPADSRERPLELTPISVPASTAARHSFRCLVLHLSSALPSLREPVRESLGCGAGRRARPDMAARRQPHGSMAMSQPCRSDAMAMLLPHLCPVVARWQPDLECGLNEIPIRVPLHSQGSALLRTSRAYEEI